MSQCIATTGCEDSQSDYTWERLATMDPATSLSTALWGRVIFVMPKQQRRRLLPVIPGRLKRCFAIDVAANTKRAQSRD